MSVEELESLESLKQMCEETNNHNTPSVPESPSSPEVSDTDSAKVFDLNDLLFLALQMEEQLKYNQEELLE